MSLPQRGEMEISLGGVVRQWFLNWRAIGEIENAIKQLEGKAVGWPAFLRRGMEWSIQDWALVLWSGLYARDKTITLEYVLDTATHDLFAEFQGKFWTLGEEFIPDSVKKKMSVTAEATN
jgi:hypothetical protein